MKNVFLLLLVCLATFSACEEEYLIDGGVANPNVGMSTYDFLKTNPIFDTLVILIDKAGLKEEVNGAVTFMAPTDFSIKNYLDAVVADMRVTDPLATYTINDIPQEELMELRSYIIPQMLSRDKLSTKGIVVPSMSGEARKLSLEPRDIYSDYLSSKPEFVYFYKQKGVRWDDYAEEGLSPEEQDQVVQVRTSGLISTKGIIHVLQGNHRLFFYESIN
ncbi:MAG: hypothetical protein ACWA6U_13690 [Breznakibacter sp.]